MPRPFSASLPCLLRAATVAASCLSPVASFLLPPAPPLLLGQAFHRARRPAHSVASTALPAALRRPREHRDFALRMGGGGGAGRGITLVVSTTKEHDPASENMADALLERAAWTPVDAGEHKVFRSSGNPDVFFWARSDSMLGQDNVDQEFADVTGQACPRDVVFLSRHASKEGRAALTVHPIGNPGAARSDMGGIPFKCPPPSPRLGSLYRRLYRATAEADLAQDFDVSLEATHHGPWLLTPALFAEIGSTPSDWGRKDASRVWADVLYQELGLGGGDAGEPEESRVVIVGIGGGHYAPKLGDLARGAGVGVGHILPSYALDFSFGEDHPGGWRQAVSEAVEATRRVHPQDDPSSPEVVCFVDKKAFKAPHRDALTALVLEEVGARVVYKASDLFAKPPGVTSGAEVSRTA